MPSECGVISTTMKEFTIWDDDIPLHAKLEKPREGKCPLLVILHGLTGHMEERHILGFTESAQILGFATLRVELFGHGSSGGNFRDHNLFKWLNNVMTVTDYAESLDFVTEIFLCGHSQGGLTAMLAAGMRPNSYRAILPLSPALVILDGAQNGNLFGMHFEPDNIPDELDLNGRILSGNYLRSAQLLDLEAAIRRYRRPVLLVHGEADESVPVECSLKAASQYGNAKLVIIPEDDHCYHLHLDKALQAVTEFLQQFYP